MTCLLEQGAQRSTHYAISKLSEQCLYIKWQGTAKVAIRIWELVWSCFKPFTLFKTNDYKSICQWYSREWELTFARRRPPSIVPFVYKTFENLLLQSRGGRCYCSKTHYPANEDSDIGQLRPIAKKPVPLLSGYRFSHIIYTSTSASRIMGHIWSSGPERTLSWEYPG